MRDSSRSVHFSQTYHEGFILIKDILGKLVNPA